MHEISSESVYMILVILVTNIQTKIIQINKYLSPVKLRFAEVTIAKVMVYADSIVIFMCLGQERSCVPEYLQYSCCCDTIRCYCTCFNI